MGCGGNTDSVSSEGKKYKNLPKYVAIGLTVIGLNLFGNLTPYLYTDANFKERLNFIDERQDGLYQKRQRVNDKLVFLRSLNCKTEECLESKKDLELFVDIYNKEWKRYEEEYKKLSKLREENHKKHRSRSFIYGYFRN